MKHQVTEHILESGARGLFIHVPGAAVTSGLVRFNSGFQFADQNKFELPHVMEHVLATVSEKYHTPNGFTIEAEKNGAYTNASTNASANGYVFECADFERERMLDLLEEQLVRPWFEASSFNAETGNVREELTKYTTEYGRVSYVALAEKAFPGQMLGFQTRINQLASITLADLEEHYRRTHTARNARFFIAGDLAKDGDVVLGKLEKLFSQLPVGERLSVNDAVGLHQPKPVMQTAKIKQLYYNFYRYCEGIDEADRPAVTVLRLMLVGGFASLVKGEARERGLAYGIGFGTELGKGNSTAGFSGFVTPDNAEALFEVISRHWRGMLDGSFDHQRMIDAKALGIGSTRRGFQTVGDIAGWYVGAYDRDDLIVDFDDYLERVQAVTLEQVSALVRKITSANRSGLAVVGEIPVSKAEELLKIIL